MSVDEFTGRQRVARAVHQLVRARGRQDTRRALLELAAEAQQWADDLAEAGEDHPQERAA